MPPRCPICLGPSYMDDDILCAGCDQRVYACTCMKKRWTPLRICALMVVIVFAIAGGFVLYVAKAPTNSCYVTQQGPDPKVLGEEHTRDWYFHQWHPTTRHGLCAHIYGPGNGSLKSHDQSLYVVEMIDTQPNYSSDPNKNGMSLGGTRIEEFTSGAAAYEYVTKTCPVH